MAIVDGMIAPAAAQSAADLDGTLTGNVKIRPYLAPKAWMDGNTLKTNYWNPEDVLAVRNGHIIPDGAAPDPAQLDTPVSLAAADWDYLTDQYTTYNTSTGHWAGDEIPQTPAAWTDPGDFLPGSGQAYILKTDYLSAGQFDLWQRYAVVPDIEIDPPAARFTPTGYVLPDVTGAVWLVNDEETAAGTYSVQPVDETTVIVIEPTPAEGYLFTSEPVPITHTFEPIPDPGPDDPTGTKEGAAYIARLMKRAQLEDELEQLETYYEQVRMFVMGYTRGRGFDVYGKPKPPLMAVICAGAARLAGNPEQVSMYQMDNITVRPAVFQGYTLAEQGVLHNYRRRQA